MPTAAQRNRLPRNQRLTKGCQHVLNVLRLSHNLTTAQDIHAQLRKGDPKSPGLTTVYRSLDMLVSMGLVQAVVLGDGERRFEVVEPGEHHHHLVCDQCHQSVHLDQCLVEDLERSVEANYGFEIRSHVLEIFGICRDCAKDGRQSRQSHRP